MGETFESTLKGYIEAIGEGQVSRKEVICEEDESIEWDKELIRGRIMK
jgi:hypothetical protein